jgi:phosphatidate cytidylyltransferase
MKRILTAVVLIPVFVWVILFAPFEAFRIALVIVGALAYVEFAKIAGLRDAVPVWPGIAAGIIVMYAREPGTILVLTALLGMGLALREQDLKDSLSSAAAFTLGVVYIFGAWRYAAELWLMNPHWLMFAMLLSWAGDAVALYVGKAFGKNKMAPRVSPAKTWEGAIGSMIGSLAGGVVYAYFLIPSAPIIQVLALAAVGNIAGQLGDLCESALKRGAGVKDSGTLLPGHGGWLDRIDSSLFAVPAVYALLFYAEPIRQALPSALVKPF